VGGHRRSPPTAIRKDSGVGYFADADDVYATLGTMLEEVLGDDELGPAFSRADCVIRWNYTNPEAEITAELVHGEETRVDFGPSDLEPDVVMTMDADVAHAFWLGEVNVALALTRGQILATGPVDPILRLVPLARRAFPFYRQLLEDQGRAVGPQGSADAVVA
jgi:hypothetical protein